VLMYSHDCSSWSLSQISSNSTMVITTKRTTHAAPSIRVDKTREEELLEFRSHCVARLTSLKIGVPSGST
jgi:hypothetical protein